MIRRVRSWSPILQANIVGLGLMFWLLVYNPLLRPLLHDRYGNDTTALCAAWVCVCVVVFGWDGLQRDAA